MCFGSLLRSWIIITYSHHMYDDVTKYNLLSLNYFMNILITVCIYDNLYCIAKMTRNSQSVKTELFDKCLIVYES